MFTRTRWGASSRVPADQPYQRSLGRGVRAVAHETTSGECCRTAQNDRRSGRVGADQMVSGGRDRVLNSDHVDLEHSTELLDVNLE
jgi:hypothetical protein